MNRRMSASGAGAWAQTWRMSLAACACLAMAGCASGDLAGTLGGSGAQADAPPPNLEEDAIARMSAETRYSEAIGCASTARLALLATTPDVLTEMGMPADRAATASAGYAADLERNADMGEAAARDAMATGQSLGKSQDEIVTTLEADYQRLRGAFAGVVEPQPELALYTIDDRLTRCRGAYVSG